MKTFKPPLYVTAVRDRHGRTRYRFRRKGVASAYIPGAPGTPEFHARYAELLAQEPVAAPSIASPVAAQPRSIDDLYARLKATSGWKAQAPGTRATYGRILDRFVDRLDKQGRRYGQRPVDRVTVAWIDNILGTMSETPAAANNLRKALIKLFQRAVKLGWRSDNPARDADTYAKGAGHHTWTEADIAAFRARHPLGSTARLVLELAHNSAARKCNIAAMTRDDIFTDADPETGLPMEWIKTPHVKAGEVTEVPLLPETRAALDALPAQPIRHLVTTSFGRPYTVNGLGNAMRVWCDEAGLPHCTMHGIRKAFSRRAAESGATDAEGMAVTGQRKAETFAYYRQKANRRVLAKRAMSNLAERFDVQPLEKGGDTDG